jgi:protein-L-isoaspartate O-methyltransferase
VTEQLVEGGWVVAPVGSSGTQQVVRYRATGGELVEDRRMVPVRFVPLVEDPR